MNRYANIHFWPVTLLLALGCATGAPRVVEVARTERVATINPVDLAVFGDDRASRIRIEPRPIADELRGEEFFVRWRGAPTAVVKLEYRQLDKPDTVATQTIVATNRSSAVFHVRGAEFIDGGKVTAWRVTLWPVGDETQPLAAKQSAVW